MNQSPVLLHFGEELRIAREGFGLSQEQLGQAVYVSKSLIAMVENGRRVPQRELAVALDSELKTGGRLDRMRRRLLVPECSPAWFRPWLDYEREATEIRDFAPLLVPGLVQTEEYARAVLGDTEQVDARMERQEILGWAALTVILTESVLRGHCVGGPEVMRGQLLRLAEDDRVVVQVLPDDAATTCHLDGPFVLAHVDGQDVAHLDTPARGFVLDKPEVVSEMRGRWEKLIAESLPRNPSRELIVRAAESWQSR